MTAPTPPPAPEAPAAAERAWPWVVALAAAGAVLSVLPHLVRLATTGEGSYVADGDGLLYLAWSRDVVRHGSLTLTDAIHRPSGPMMHPWLLFVPPALIAHVLGLGAAGLGVVWRLLAGPAVALGLYAVVRPFTRTPRGAAGLAAFLLCDAGLLVGQVLQRQAQALVAIARGSGDLLAGVPQLLPHLRVPTPALALPFFLAHIAPSAPGQAAGDDRVGPGGGGLTRAALPRLLLLRHGRRGGDGPGLAPRPGRAAGLRDHAGRRRPDRGRRRSGRRRGSRRSTPPTGSPGPTSSPRWTGSTGRT